MKTPHWAGGHHLPAMVHGGAMEAPPKSKDNIIKRLFKTDGAAGIAFGQYIRQMVPVDEWLTRVWYHHGVVTRNKFELARAWFIYWTWARWHCDYNFSQQDMSVMLNLDYSTPEKLSVTDAEVVQWRRFVVTKYFGGRDRRSSTRTRSRVSRAWSRRTSRRSAGERAAGAGGRGVGPASSHLLHLRRRRSSAVGARVPRCVSL